MPPEKDGGRRLEPDEPLGESPAAQRNDAEIIAFPRVKLNPSGIPAELRAIPQWVAWLAKPPKKPGGKWGKIPVNARTGEAASSTDPETWSSFDEAVGHAETRGLAGVGIALSEAVNLAGVDLDHCRDAETGVIAPWAQEIVTALGTYTEISPSGTGLRLFVRGSLPPGGRKKGNVEMYATGRFMTVTGVPLDGAKATIEERTEAIARLHAQVFGEPQRRRLECRTARAAPSTETDDQLIERAKSDPKFAKLWGGDHVGYGSQSEADLALCSLLAMLTGRSIDRVDRLFRRSGLFRDKWDEKHGDRTYGQLTVEKAASATRGRPSAQEFDVTVPTSVGDVHLKCRRSEGKAKAEVVAEFPGGEKFTDRVDLTSAAARTRLVGTLEKRCPEIDADDLHRKLEGLTARLAALREAWDAGDDGDGQSAGSSQADLLVFLATEDKQVELFHTPGRHDSAAFATIPVGKHRETWPVKSSAFRYWLVGRFLDRHHKVPGAQAVTDAIGAIAGIAIHNGPGHPVAIRVAEHEGTIWLDLGDDEWSTVLITRNVWRVRSSEETPVRFIRRRGMQALTVPCEGGRIDELRQFVNLPDDAQWILFVACLVAYLRPRGPYPILVANGEQGSAKSWLCRILRALIDPNKAPLRRPPREDRDLMIAATNGWVVAFDNLSSVPAWLSDALCSIATGGGFATRELYTDDEEKLFDAMRPILLNGIEDLATRPDLLDRAVVLSLPTIPDDQRIEEDVIAARFEAARPRILGALLTALSAALHNHAHVVLPSKPRMADFAVWATAAEPGLGWEPGTFMRVYAGNREQVNSIAIESSTVGSAIVAFLREREAWDGTATDLLADLERALGDEVTRKRPDWPKIPRVLSGAVRRIAPNLRRVGIGVEFSKRGGGASQRFIHLRKEGHGASPASPTSPNGTGGGASGDDAGRNGDDGSPAGEIHRPQETATGGPPNPDGDAGDARDAGIPTSTTSESFQITEVSDRDEDNPEPDPGPNDGVDDDPDPPPDSLFDDGEMPWEH